MEEDILVPHKKHKPWWLIPVVPAAAVIAVVIAGFFMYPLPDSIRLHVVSLLQKNLGPSTHIGGVYLIPWKSVVIKDAVCSIKGKEGSRTDLEIEEIGLSYDILYVLKNATKLPGEFKRIVKTGGSPDSGKSPGNKNQGLAMVSDLLSGPIGSMVKEFHIKGGSVDLLDNKKVVLHAAGISAKLTFTVTDTPSCSGPIAIDTVVANGQWRATRIKSGVMLKADMLTLEKLRCALYDGTLSGEVRLRLFPLYLESGEVKVTNLDLWRIYSNVKDAPGTVRGKGHGTFELGPCPLSEDSIRGNGRITLKKLSVDNLPLQNSIITFFTMPGLAHIEFDELNMRLRLRGERIYNDTLSGDGRPLGIDASGWYVPSTGQCSQKLKGTLTAEFNNSLASIVRNSLMAEPQGRSSFGCTITGTFNNPRISLQKEIMQRAVQNVFEELIKAFK